MGKIEHLSDSIPSRVLNLDSELWLTVVGAPAMEVQYWKYIFVDKICEGV